MSGFAGVRWNDGRTATVGDAEALLAYVPHPRGRPVLMASGSAAMGCLGAPVESSASRCQPHRGHQVAVMIDGRIDNTEDLIRTLEVPRQSSDRAIVAAAWRKWGRDCAARLTGEFVCTIFDADRVFFVRDCGPFRALYYRPATAGCYWASTVVALVQPERPPINEGMVAEYLADRISTANETLFSGVYRLPPAHAMELGADGGLRVWQYWHPDPRAELRYRDQREYDEHFRVLFREAVRCRLRGRGRVALWYSGGVDSSAVAAQVAALRDEAEPSIARDVETVSISAPGYAVDETPVFSRGAAYHRLTNTVRSFHFGTAADFERHAASFCDVPPAPSMMGARHGWEALAAREVDVCLTGFGGDDWFIGSEFAMIDDLRALRWLSAAKRWRAERREPSGFTPTQVLRLGLWLHTPPRARALLRRALRRQAAPAQIAPGFAARVNLDDRLRATRAMPAFRTLAQRQLYESATGASVVVTAEMYSRVAAAWGIDARHPFEDRRLMEFALALPPDQLLRPAVPRYVVVSAMLKRLPRNVYSDVGGVDYMAVVRDALVTAGGRQRVEAALTEMPDWLEPAQVRKMARAIEAPVAADIGRQVWAIWQVLSIHMWWKGVQARIAPTTLNQGETPHGRSAIGRR